MVKNYKKVPLVSVIMGVYNCDSGNMLIKSIQSILNQTFQDFEFIICDDASNDKTYEILQKFSEDPRVIIIRNENNLGLASCLNKCLAIAKGKYIARQDADDYSDKDRIRLQIEFMECNSTYDLIGSNLRYFNDKEIWGQYSLPQFPENRDFLFTVPFIHATVIFKAESIRKLGGYREGKITRRCEDYDLFMRMYSAGMRGTNIQEYLYFVREDEAAQKRRKYRYRLDETRIRINGYRKLGLLPIGVLYALKPLVVGLIPDSVLQKLKDYYYKRRS